MSRLRDPGWLLVLASAPPSRTLLPERRGGWCRAAPGPPLAAASELRAATGVRRAAGRAGPGARRFPPGRGEPRRGERGARAGVWAQPGRTAGPGGRRAVWGCAWGRGSSSPLGAAAAAPAACGGLPAFAPRRCLGLVPRPWGLSARIPGARVPCLPSRWLDFPRLELRLGLFGFGLGNVLVVCHCLTPGSVYVTSMFADYIHLRKKMGGGDPRIRRNFK